MSTKKRINSIPLRTKKNTIQIQIIGLNLLRKVFKYDIMWVTMSRGMTL